MRKALLILTAMLCFCSTARAQWDKDVFSIRGRMALQDGKYADAIYHFNVLEKLDTTDYWTFFYRGIAKYNLGDTRGALKDFDRSVDLNPIFTNGYHFRAIAESRFGMYDEALNDLAKAIELRPGNIGIYYSRGVTYFLSRKFAEALQDFNHYIGREPSDASAYLNRGATNLFLGDTLSAFNDYNKAIRLNRKDAEGYVRRGRLYAAQGEYSKAIADMNVAIEKEPDNTLAYFTRAIMFHETMDYNSAMADFNKVLEYEPGNALTLYNRSLLSAQVGDFESALSDMDRVIRINPDNVLAHFNRAAMYMELGQYQDAIDDYSQAIALYPDFANAYMSRSVAEHRLGRMNASKADYNTARRKIAEYKSANDKNAGTYADTTKKYTSLLEFDGEFAKKDFNNEMLQNRDVDVRLKPLYKFTLVDYESERNILDRGYENLLIEHFTGLSPIPMTINNADTTAKVSLSHSLEYILAGDSAAGAGQSPVSEAEKYFIRGLYNLQDEMYNNALSNFNLAVQLADDPVKRDRYARYYKAFYLLNRAVLLAEMTDFIANIENNVSTLAMDDKGVARTKVKDHMTTLDYSEAIRDLQEAIALLPQVPYLHFNLGNLDCLSGKPVEAIESYTKAISLYPGMGDAYFNRGLVQILVQDKEKGCIDFSKAGELGIPDAYGMISKYCKSENE